MGGTADAALVMVENKCIMRVAVTLWHNGKALVPFPGDMKSVTYLTSMPLQPAEVWVARDDGERLKQWTRVWTFLPLPRPPGT